MTQEADGERLHVLSWALLEDTSRILDDHPETHQRYRVVAEGADGKPATYSTGAFLNQKAQWVIVDGERMAVYRDRPDSFQDWKFETSPISPTGKLPTACGLLAESQSFHGHTGHAEFDVELLTSQAFALEGRIAYYPWGGELVLPTHTVRITMTATEDGRPYFFASRTLVNTKHVFTLGTRTITCTEELSNVTRVDRDELQQTGTETTLSSERMPGCLVYSRAQGLFKNQRAIRTIELIRCSDDVFDSEPTPTPADAPPAAPHADQPAAPVHAADGDAPAGDRTR